MLYILRDHRPLRSREGFNISASTPERAKPAPGKVSIADKRSSPGNAPGAWANPAAAEIRRVNPIEHRLFPHVTRACQGVVFQTTEIVKELMEKTATHTGLRVTVDILDKVYETGRQCTKEFKRDMKIRFDSLLPQWNYRATPDFP